MFIDHAGAALTQTSPYAPVLGFSALWLRVIGRVAFPIYAFLISEGCRHTGNMKKYLLRLGLFALISEIPYDIFFGGVRQFPDLTPVIWDFTEQNVFFTLFLGALAIFWHETDKRRLSESGDKFGWVSHAALLAVIFALAEALKTDYGARGAMLIFAFYISRNKAAKIITGLAGLYALYIYPDIYEYPFNAQLFAGGTVALIFIALYNGKPGIKARWFFYAFYPAHLLALTLVFALTFAQPLFH
jgi:hypothetical protein